VSSLEYVAPRTLAEAVRALAAADGDASVLAGGTDLVAQMTRGARRPRLVLDAKRIPELLELRLEERGLRLGAAVPCAAIRERPEIRRAFPGLLDAVELIGSEQIQGRASVGGNLCNASPAADTAPALIALGAECVVSGPEGTRAVPAELFIAAPGRTALLRGEILVEIRVPPPPPRSGSAYLRLIPRAEMDIAVVGAGVSVRLDPDGRCAEARIALGAVAPTPIRAPSAERALVGTDLGPEALESAAREASEATRPIDDLRGPAWYRRRVAGVLARRALAIARDRALGRI
jgi:carbon-monoxide dehydrogenase medium subunit